MDKISRDLIQSWDADTLRKKQEERRNVIIEKIQKAPWTYVSLREQVDQGTLTLEQAQEVLKAWKKRIETQEAEDRAKDPAEVERILREEKVPTIEGEAYLCTYPKRYKAKLIDEQFDSLREILGLYGETSHPEGGSLQETPRYRLLESDCNASIEAGKVDGIFWIPPIYLTARVARELYPRETQGKADDEVALRYVLEKLTQARGGDGLPPFINDLRDATSPDRQRLHPRAALAHAANELASDFGLTFWPLQTGRTRAGESPRRVLLDLKPTLKIFLHEAPADVYLLACVLLGHPERANHVNPLSDLLVSAVGSQIAPAAASPFVEVPYWFWGGAKLILGISLADHVNDYLGGVTAFLPE